MSERTQAQLVAELGEPPFPDAVVHSGLCVRCGDLVECWAQGEQLPTTAFYCGPGCPLSDV